MGLTLVLLVGLAILALVGHRTMIAVKPDVPRPALDAAPRAEVAALQVRLMEHVRTLGSRIGERNLTRPEALRAAADYIREVWRSQGFTVAEETYEAAGRRAANLIAEQKGSAQADAVVLVGAHYDSVAGSPGANDNATGVAVLLELSRAVKGQAMPRTLRLVAFVNEEPPFFMSEEMGSRVHARGARRRGERIVAMLSLETLGYYADAPGSQRYPFPFGLFYPHTGNFVAVVGNLPSRGLVVDFLRHFMAGSDFPVEGAATFEWIPGINWSDHWSFWKEGYPALMLTDTAPFRYPFYHSPQDLPDKINGPQFARAAHGIIEAVRRLAAAQ
jgi:Zn-dependent M28 family amino/carboxypeptidase